MATQQITISLPDALYLRLEQAARATRQSMPDIVLRAVQIGSPPTWDDAPAPYQAALAALDRQTDATLWQIARQRMIEVDSTRYDALLDKNSEEGLSAIEKQELEALRSKADLFMLQKAHAAALLRWRGHVIPPANKL